MDLPVSVTRIDALAAGAPALLQFQAVSKRFGGTQAVDAVTLDVHAGEILALLGENGAGKSTLIKLLAGIYPADSGEIVFDGRPQAAWRRADKSKETPGRPKFPGSPSGGRTPQSGGLGGDREPVAFIHQDLGLVEWMKVAENVALGMG